MAAVFRSVCGAFFLAVLAAAAAYAQAVPVSCTASSILPAMARMEGLAEPVGDLTITCTGGVPVAAGAPLPAININVTFDADVTSRILYPGSSPWLEALLLVDNPQPGAERPCTDASGYCSVVAGDPVPNIFQGTLASARTVQFANVPFDPPGPQRARVLRITNIRVNASQLPYNPPGPTSVGVFVSISGASAPPLSQPWQSVAQALPTTRIEFRSGDNARQLTQPVPLQSCNGLSNQSVALMEISEPFADGFKPRTAAPYAGPDSSPAPVAQNLPGVAYSTESMYYNPSLPTGDAVRNIGSAGLATTGTRLRAVFTNVPAGVTLRVSTVPVKVYAGVLSVNPDSVARLIASEGLAFSPVAPDADIAGIPAAAIPLSGGTGQAVWEVLKANPAAYERLIFPVYVTYSSASVSLGTASVALGFAPVSGAGAASATASLPRFANGFWIQAQLFSVVGTCSCNYSIDMPSTTAPFAGTTGNFRVACEIGCPWTAVSNAPWITVTGGATGAGNGVVDYSVAPNPFPVPRTGTITVAGRTFTVNQLAGCTFTIDPPARSFHVGGGSGTVFVTTGGGCAWTAVSGAPWITVDGGAYGNGFGTVWYSVAANPGTVSRTGAIQIAGQTFTVTQSPFSNDEPAGATLVSSVPFSATQPTTAATKNSADPTHTCGPGGQDSATVWFRFVSPFTGSIRLSTQGSDYDTVLTAYPGTTVPGAQLACNDNYGAGPYSRLDLAVTAGQSYLFEVSAAGPASPGGSLALAVSALGAWPVIDTNRDGKSDILWQHQTNGDAWWWTLNGTSVQNYGFMGWNATYRLAVSGDFNGDGHVDIIVQHPSTGEAYVWFLTGGSYSSYAAVSAPTAWRIVGASDFNGDGQLDLLWQLPGSGNIWVWFMNGAVYSSDRPLIGTTGNYRVAATGDVNGDGYADIVWQHLVNRDVWVWYMQGVSYFSSRQLSGPIAYDVAGLGDYNGDGKLDLLWQHPSNGDVWAWFFNNGVYFGYGQIAGPISYKVYGWK